ncbi:MAG TPA: MaoC family dehydratase [Blastocatellia bacterium]|nr:MaoC family dehydratase [Blastocatellia bacterium]
MGSDANARLPIKPRYGRLLNDFKTGDVYHHPWEVTIDDGLLAMFAASFPDPNPLYSSRRFALDMGFRDRVVHPLALMNLALSFSVHDVSEQSVAHLAYLSMKFPNPAYVGDTFSAFSRVIGGRVSKSQPAYGVVHVQTVGMNQDRQPVISFERKALVPQGVLAGRAHPAPPPLKPDAPALVASAPHFVVSAEVKSLPLELTRPVKMPLWRGRPAGLFEDFKEGDIILHSVGRTVGESEHMQLATLFRNSHPLHTDEVYSRKRSFAGTRVVYGGLVFAWVASLASRDTSANALWEMGFDNGAHPSPVLAGDTLYAASRVIEKREQGEQRGTVRFHLVGVKNERPSALLKAGVDLFGDKFEAKVFEIERMVLLPRRSVVF